jgi:Secretion system C-terminal sorting domain
MKHFSQNLRVIYLLLLWISLYPQHAISQSPPTEIKTGYFDRPLIDPLASSPGIYGCGRTVKPDADMDWFFDVAHCTDGGNVFAGYTTTGGSSYKDYSGCSQGVGILPLMVKYDESGNLLWYENTSCDFGSRSYLLEVIENQKGEYVGVGYGDSKIIVHVIDAVTGKHKDGSPYSLSYHGKHVKANSIKEIPSALGGGYIICGIVTDDNTSYIMRLDNNFKEVWSKEYAYLDASRAWTICIVKAHGDLPDGFAFTGEASDNSLNVTVAYTVRTDLNGNKLWQHYIKHTELPTSKYTAWFSSDWNTKFNPTTTTRPSVDKGRYIIQNNEGNIVISGYLGLVNTEDCDGEYNDAEAIAYELKDDASLFTPEYNRIKHIVNYAHCSGGDFIPHIKQDVDGYYVVTGTTADDHMLSISPTAGFSTEHDILKKIDLTASSVTSLEKWHVYYQMQDDPLASYGTCAFGFDFTGCNGFVTCGNNGDNGDDGVFRLWTSDYPTANVTYAPDLITTPVSVSGSISGYTAWSGYYRIKGIVTVKADATLDVTNATLVFANECSGILVEDKGKLKLSGSRLSTNVFPSNSSGYLWQGILAEGASSVYINQTVIEHAATALDMESTHNTSGTSSPVLRCDGGTFLNNQMAVLKSGATHIPGTYQFDMIKNSSFDLDANASAMLHNPVNYIRYINGDDIYLANMTPPITDFNGYNTFSNHSKNLRVSAVENFGGYLLTAVGNTFEAIDRNILAQGTRYAHVELNSFTKIPMPDPFDRIDWVDLVDNFAFKAVGTPYYLYSNNIEGTYDPTNVPACYSLYGIIADNTGSNGAMTYKNNIKGTFEGLHLQNDNHLHYISCNLFDSYIYHSATEFSEAIVIADFATIADQGNGCGTVINNKPAGNQFNALCDPSIAPGISVDITVGRGVNSFRYFCYDNLLTTPKCSTPDWKDITSPLPTFQNCFGSSFVGSSCDQPFAICPGCRVKYSNPYISNQLLLESDNNTENLTALLYNNQNKNEYNAEIAKQRSLMHWTNLKLVSEYLVKQMPDSALSVLLNSSLPDDKISALELAFHLSAKTQVESLIASLNNQNVEKYWFKDNSEFISYRENTVSMTKAYNLMVNIEERPSDSIVNKLTGILVEFKQLSSWRPMLEALYTQHAKKVINHPVLTASNTQKAEEISKSGTNAPLVFPNPANDAIRVNVPVNFAAINSSVTIYNALGLKVATSISPTEGNEFKLDVSALPQGVYLAIISSSNKTLSSTFIISR